MRTLLHRLYPGYHRSIHNFVHLYRPIASSWLVYDNNQLNAPRVIAVGGDAGGEMVLIEAAWRQMLGEAMS